MAFVKVENSNLETPPAIEGSSVYALPFDEFEHALGDPGADLGSINMGEFLRNIWTAEESQAMAAAMNPLDGSNGCLATQIYLHPGVNGPGSMNMDEFLRSICTAEEGQAMAADMNRLDGFNDCLATRISGTLCLPRTLSMKMVEEVWKSLQPQQETLESEGSGMGQQVNLGEVTLEDFLVKAGIVRESAPCNPSPHSFQGKGQGNDARYKRSCNENRPMGLIRIPPPSIDIKQQDGMLSPVHTPAQQGDWMVRPSNKAFSQQKQHETKQILQGSAMIDGAPSYSNTPMSPGHDESSADTSNLMGILVQPGRKRRSEGPIEKVIQRRQRRMIKNRESAARSRARKQAYTVELEEEVYQLKEENMKLLRKQEEESELRNQQLWSIFGNISQVSSSKLLKKLEDWNWVLQASCWRIARAIYMGTCK